MNPSNFISETFISIFSQSLIHSLWQGAIVLAACSFALVIIDRKNAKLRSAISYLSMCMLLVGFVITFVLVYSNNSKQHAQRQSTTEREIQSQSTLFESNSIEENSKSIFDLAYTVSKKISLLSEENSTMIFTVWVLGLFVLSLRISGGYFHTHRIKQKDITPVSHYWHKKILIIAKTMKLKKKFNVYESPHTKQPIVIGYIKPVILLPTAMLLNIPYNQAEAIVLHEIAHIKRADYLLNLFQSALEVMFFFNPAIWILSSIVRKEREFACDDTALKYCINKNDLAKALLSIEESKETLPLLSLGILKNKNSLLGRIKRMKHQNKTSFDQQRKISGIIILLTVVSIAMLVLQPLKNYSTTIHGSDSQAVNQASLFETFMPRDSNMSATEKDYEKEIYDTTKTHKHKSEAEHNHNVSVDVDLSGLDDFHYEFESEEFEKNIANLGEELSKLENMKFDFNFDFNFEKLGKNLPLSPEDSIEFHEEMRKVNEELASLKDIKIELDLDKNGFNEAMDEFKTEMKKHKEEMKNLKLNMKELKKETKSLGGFLKETKEEMVRDGYIDNADEDIDLELSKKSMKIDGNVIDAWTHAKYLNIYKNHFGKELKDEINIK